MLSQFPRVQRRLGEGWEGGWRGGPLIYMSVYRDRDQYEKGGTIL